MAQASKQAGWFFGFQYQDCCCTPRVYAWGDRFQASGALGNCLTDLRVDVPEGSNPKPRVSRQRNWAMLDTYGGVDATGMRAQKIAGVTVDGAIYLGGTIYQGSTTQELAMKRFHKEMTWKKVSVNDRVFAISDEDGSRKLYRIEPKAQNQTSPVLLSSKEDWVDVHASGNGGLLALDSTGLMWGSTSAAQGGSVGEGWVDLASSGASLGPITGWLSGYEITNPGEYAVGPNGETPSLTATVSAPDRADGRQATVTLILARFSQFGNFYVSGIRYNNRGMGYDSPPTITVSGTSVTPASITGIPKNLRFSAFSADKYSNERWIAIDQSGEVWLTGYWTQNQVATDFSFVEYLYPRKPTTTADFNGKTWSAVAVGGIKAQSGAFYGTALLHTDGTLYFMSHLIDSFEAITTKKWKHITSPAFAESSSGAYPFLAIDENEDLFMITSRTLQPPGSSVSPAPPSASKISASKWKKPYGSYPFCAIRNEEATAALGLY